MIKTVIFLIVFSLTLFFYLHIHFHKRISNDLEIYDINNPSKDKLEEVCDLKQPVIFSNCLEENLAHSIICQKFESYDVNVRNDKYIIEKTDGEELFLNNTLKNVLKMLKNDKNRNIIVENNMEFLHETLINKIYNKNGNFLKPYFTFYKKYDYVFGSENSTTVLKYDVYYRNFFQIVQGNVRIKMCSPKNKKLLYELKDYENYEFVSPINPWDVQNEYKETNSKIKWLDITLTKDDVIFIPAYWWYSFELTNDAVLARYSYNSYISSLSVINHNLLYFLQNQNIKRITEPTLNKKE